MALELLSAHLTEKEYIAQRFKQCNQTGRATQSPISNFKLFTKDTFNIELPALLDELRNISDTETQINKTLVICQKFINWLAVPHPELRLIRADGQAPRQCIAKDPDTIKVYISQIRLYLRKVGGIRLTSEDLSDFVSFPAPVEKDEVIPLLPSEFKKICKRANHRRAMLYRIKKDCCARIGAMVQLRRKHFNLEVRPIEVTFPKHIMKKKNGISFTNVKYIIQEDEEELLDYLAKFPDPESLIWGTSEIVENAVSAEEHYWQRLMVRMGYDQKYSHNNRLIKNIHSIKSLTFTAAVEAVNETFANAYGDHSRYIKNYLRWTKEQKIEKFRKLEKHISFFSRYELVTDDMLEKENDRLQQEAKERNALLEKLTTETKEKTKVKVDEKTRQMMVQLLKENNLI